jgi:superfamily II DNA or RNA helicase
MLDSKRDEIQNLAIQTWVETGKKGTINLSTGIGKTFSFIKATRFLPKGSKILFLAETSQREFDLQKDIAFLVSTWKSILKKYAKAVITKKYKNINKTIISTVVYY